MGQLFQLILSVLLLVVPSLLSAASLPTVFVSILPQKFFVQQISKGRVQIEVMVQPGASPATYEPKPSQMKKLSEAAAYFAVGVPFEKSWLERIRGVNHEMPIVHTDEGIKKLAMNDHSHERDHSEDKDASEHSEHDGLDPHVWLSPVLVKKQVSVIADTLGRLFPEDVPFFQQNLLDFTQKIDLLREQLHATLKNKEGRSFMVFHPSWGYFAHEFGLNQVAVEVEGKNPKPAQLRELIEQARKDDIRVVFAQPQFSSKSAKLIAREINGEVITLDPLAENWLENMKMVSEKLKNSMK